MKQLPIFNNEKEERDFWQIHDSADYFDLSKAVKVNQNIDFPSLLKSSDLPRVFNTSNLTGSFEKALR